MGLSLSCGNSENQLHSDQKQSLLLTTLLFTFLSLPFQFKCGTLLVTVSLPV